MAMLGEAKARKPYTKTKQRERWTEDEHTKFLEAVQLYGRAWRKIEEHIGTKSTVQIRSHAQKFFAKCERETSSSPHQKPSWVAGVVDEAASIGCTAVTGKHVDAFHVPPPRPKRKPDHPYPKKPSDVPTIHSNVPFSCVQGLGMPAIKLNVDGSNDTCTMTDRPTGIHVGGSTDAHSAFSSSRNNGMGASALWRKVGRFHDGGGDATSFGAASGPLYSVSAPNTNAASNLQATSSRANALAAVVQQAQAVAAAAATIDKSSIPSFSRTNLSPASTTPQHTSSNYVSLLQERLASSGGASSAAQASTSVIAKVATPLPANTVDAPASLHRGNDGLDSMRDWLNAMPAALRASGVEAVAAAVAAAAGGHFNPGTVLDPAVLASLAAKEDSRRMPPAVAGLTAAALASATSSSTWRRGDTQGDALHSGEQGQHSSRDSRPCAGASTSQGRNSRDSSPSLQTGSDGTGSDGGQPEQDDMGDAQAMQRSKDHAAAVHRTTGLAGTRDSGGPFAGFGYSAEFSPYHCHAAAGAGISTLLGATQSTHAAAQAAAQMAAMQAAQAQATAAHAQHQHLLAIRDAINAGHIQSESQQMSQEAGSPRSSYAPWSNTAAPYNGPLSGLPAWAAVPGAADLFAEALRAAAASEAAHNSARVQEAAQDSSTNAPFAAMSHAEALRMMQLMMAGGSSHHMHASQQAAVHPYFSQSWTQGPGAE